jgi:hypothetical protein
MPSTRKSVDSLIAKPFFLCTLPQYIHTLISSARETSFDSNTLTQSTKRQKLAWQYRNAKSPRRTGLCSMLRLYLMHPFASSSAFLQSKSILCGLKKLRSHSCGARMHPRVIYTPRRTGLCPMLRLYLMHPFASSSASLQSKSILCGLKILRTHSCRARTHSRVINTQCYLFNYVPSLKATS